MKNYQYHLLLIFLFSTVSIGSADDTLLVTHENILITTEKVSTSIPKQISFTVPDILDTIYAAILRGEYPSVIKDAESLKNTITDEETVYILDYFTAIAHYNILLRNHIYNVETRSKSRILAEELFHNTSQHVKDPQVAGRSLIWYAMTMHISYTDYNNKKKAIDALNEIASRRFEDTGLSDDAIFIKARIYMDIGWYGSARHYFKKLLSKDHSGNILFDPWRNEYRGAPEAAANALSELRRICVPQKENDLSVN